VDRELSVTIKMKNNLHKEIYKVVRGVCKERDEAKPSPETRSVEGDSSKKVYWVCEG